MAGSQLKRLKASLREQGITGPQKSKKQRRKLAQDGHARNEKRLQRGVVLDGIREQFNPFDLKHAARGPKFEVTTNRPTTGSSAIKGRPGVAKALSEEKRKQTLLIDMQHRNKVGGIIDRRFGENDPTMNPEEKMLERFAREKQRNHKKTSMFDLEDDEPMDGLTHMGKSLELDDQEEFVDDFQEDDLDGEDSDGSEREMQRRKRLRAIVAADGDEEEDGQPERKKTKKEVMEEIIAKSKLHKYERQAAKENDDDLRMQLDQELPNIQVLLSSGLNGSKRTENGITNIAGVDRESFDRSFDVQVKQLAQDRRAQPSDRTKTEEEKADEEAKKLKMLEEKRQKRMMGEVVSDSDEEGDQEDKSNEMNEEVAHDDEGFGLGSGIKARPTATDLGFEDEDDFIIDDDLVASGSDLELMDSDEEPGEGNDGEITSEDDDEDDDEFIKGILDDEEAKNPIFQGNASVEASAVEKHDEYGLPFTFPCPQSSSEFISITSDYSPTTLPKIVQRIRALYHPKLDSKNKERLANFAVVLVDFINLSWDSQTSPPFSVLESLIRHIHSLAKMFPIEIAQRFRHHLETIGQTRSVGLRPSDLVLLTAIGTVFPTSDHFHQVVTPAMLTISRYLGQKVPQDLSDYATGVYLAILSLQYQQLSKRYVPEVINFTLNTICSLSPTAPSKKLGSFPVHEPPPGVRVHKSQAIQPRRLNFSDCLPSQVKEVDNKALKVALLDTSIHVLHAAADLWTGKSAFLELFSQVDELLQHIGGQSCRAHLPSAICERSDKLSEKLRRMSRIAQLSRRPLELHHHRPLAIKTFIPKFEETFDPDKHYDPDRERAELAKLKKEYKKERKGAMRELRKDANFMAREKLRAKKAKDEAYEKKYKRLVAEIQNEEGREANAYEREAKARKRAAGRK